MVMPRVRRKPGRPRGSRSVNRGGYALRTLKVKEKYGDDAFGRWGKRRWRRPASFFDFG
jgi:hypothetical protein